MEPWGEAELLECLLRPAAAVLAELQARQLTHRAIRPANLFRAGPGHKVVLGCAWAMAPAAMQPAVFEPPYSAMCHPAGRGEGSIADDVYALGVTLLSLALGRVPHAEISATDLIRRKLELGSFQALTNGQRLSPMIADLVRGMLAEDPEHRPAPALLADPQAARSRRVAARPPRRAQRPLEVGSAQVWDARSLAYAIATDSGEGARLLRSGAIDHWLRRGLGDASIAARVDEAVRPRSYDIEPERGSADAHLVMRAVAMLDPLAPICWGGLSLWPDGLPWLLAAEDTQDGAAAGLLHQLVASEAMATWGSLRPGRSDAQLLRMEARRQAAFLRQPGWTGGLAVLRYALNPLLPCRSPMLREHRVVGLEDLLPALEAAATRAGDTDQHPLDRELVSFIAARADHRVIGQLATLGERLSPMLAAIAQLRVLALLQARLQTGPVPALAARLGALGMPALLSWRNRARREQRRAALAGATSSGDLPALLALLDDPAARGVDAQEAAAAEAELRRLDAELARLAADNDRRAEVARLIGQEAVRAVGGIALAAAAVAAVIG
jgi:hypothetical protein